MRVKLKPMMMAVRIANCLIEERMVYTNKIPCGHMRAPGDPQDQSCAGVPRGDFENLARLFGGERRIALEKAPRVGERDVD